MEEFMIGVGIGQLVSLIICLALFLPYYFWVRNRYKKRIEDIHKNYYEQGLNDKDYRNYAAYITKTTRDKEVE